MPRSLSPNALFGILVLFGWALLVGLRLTAGWDVVMGAPQNDPDSVLRLVQVRDWLNGAGWFDLTQQRLGPAGVPTAMHWTRIGDLVPATIIALLTPVVGTAMAEHWAMVITPLVLLLPLVGLTLGAARRLGGDDAVLPALFALATSLGMLASFTPGDIDHHSLQLLAVLIIVFALSGARTAANGALAAFGTVLSLIIGIETVPVMLAMFGVLAIVTIWLPRDHTAFARGLGLGIVGMAIAGLAFMPQPWTGAWCDAWTIPVVALTLGTGFAFLTLALTGPRPRWVRLVLPGAVALAALVAVLTAYPACRTHPAGADPLLWTYWIDNIGENVSLADLIAEQGWGAVPLYTGVALPLIGFLLWSLARGRLAVARWAPLVAGAVAAFVLAAVHIRGQVLLGGLLVPLAGAAIALSSRRVIGYTLLTPLPWLVLGVLTIRTVPPGPGDLQPGCRTAAVMAALNRLPPSTMIVPLGVEPFLLRDTRHRSVAGNFHRNRTGIPKMIRAMISDPAAARRQIQAVGARYLVYCPGYDVSGIYARSHPDSLAAALVADRAPGWLVPVTRLSGNVRIYRVD